VSFLSLLKVQVLYVCSDIKNEKALIQREDELLPVVLLITVYILNRIECIYVYITRRLRKSLQFQTEGKIKQEAH
jgi:hypothetical protein